MTQELSNKADLALANLAADGGLLSPEQNDTFIRNVLSAPTMLRSVRSFPMNGPEAKLNKIGIGQRMLAAARQTAGNRSLTLSERTKPTTSQIVVRSSEVIAELRLPYEVLEDNIERGGLENTVLALIGERAALDLEELLLLGDTASVDTYLALQNGVLKRAVSNIVNGTGLGITPDLFNNTVKAMPERYRRDRANMRYFVSANVEQDYRNDQAKRGTGLGDATLTGAAPIQLFGSSLEGTALMPQVNGIYTNPRNILFGIQRNVRIETDKDISAREVIIVVTARVGMNIEEESALVKMTNIGVA